MVAVEDGIDVGEVGGVGGVQEDGAGDGGAAVKGAGEVGFVVGGLDDGVIDVSAGDFNPGDGVRVSGKQGGEVNGFSGGGVGVVSGRGDDGGGEVLVGGVLAPGIYQVTGADGEAGDQGDTRKDNQEVFGSEAVAGTGFGLGFGLWLGLRSGF